jgi:hypothetical protein
MNKKIILLLLLTLSFFIQSGEVLVTIDNIVKEIGKSSSCNITDWAHKFENSCVCCLIKQVPDLKQEKTTAYEIIQDCISQGYCDSKTINTFIKENVGQEYSVNIFDANAEEILKKLLFGLYEKSIVIKEIEPSKELTFDNFGNFTEQSLSQFLAQAYKDKKLTNPDFAKIDCITTKNLVGYAPASSNLTQLFLITSQCSIPRGKEYILKDLKLGQVEASRLARLASLPEIKNIENKPNFPVVIFPVAYLSYAYNDKKHILSLMPKAAGITFSQFTDAYEKKPTEEYLKKLIEAYKQAGRDLANFHKYFMGPDKGEASLNTVRHADLHRNNVFYDEKTKTISFIDNETMMEKFNNRENAIYDVQKLIFSMLGVIDKFTIDKIVKQQMSIDLVKAFLESYINVFDTPKARKNVLDQITSLFKTIDKGEYNRYQTILESVFKELSDKF